MLLTNPGGPGGSGIELVQQAGDIFDQSVLDQFDIVSWDPRGVGASTSVNCGDDLDSFYAVDRTRADAATARASAAAAKQFDDACRRLSGDLLPYVSTSASADDMDAIRAAMGERSITYLGFSYGTYLGALYANRYPNRVRAMVLDGAIDPAQSYAAATIGQAVGFDHALGAFLSWCRNNRRCAFAHDGNPATSFDDLTITLENETLPAEIAGEKRTLGPGEANIGIATALYAGKVGWVTLGKALRDAAEGKGTALLAHHRHPMAAIWDDGTTSSSDGQYFRAGGRAGSTTTRRRRSTRSAASTLPRHEARRRCCVSQPAPRARRPFSARRMCGSDCRARSGRPRRWGRLARFTPRSHRRSW